MPTKIFTCFCPNFSIFYLKRGKQILQINLIKSLRLVFFQIVRNILCLCTFSVHKYGILINKNDKILINLIIPTNLTELARQNALN